MNIKTYKRGELTTLEKLLLLCPDEDWNYCHLLYNPNISLEFLRDWYDKNPEKNYNKLCITCINNYSQIKPEYAELTRMSNQEQKEHSTCNICYNCKEYKYDCYCYTENNKPIINNTEKVNVYQNIPVILGNKMKLYNITIPFNDYINQPEHLEIIAIVLSSRPGVDINQHPKVINFLEDINNHPNTDCCNLLTDSFQFNFQYIEEIDLLLDIFYNHKHLINCDIDPLANHTVFPHANKICNEYNCSIMSKKSQLFHVLEINHNLTWDHYLKYKLDEGLISGMKKINIQYVLQHSDKNWNRGRISHNGKLSESDIDMILNECSNYPDKFIVSNKYVYGVFGPSVIDNDLWDMTGLGRQPAININHIINYKNLIQYWNFIDIINNSNNISFSDTIRYPEFNWNYSRTSYFFKKNLTYSDIANNLHLDICHFLEDGGCYLNLDDIDRLLNIDAIKNKRLNLSNRDDLTVDFILKHKKYIDFQTLSSNKLNYDKYDIEVAILISESPFIIQDLYLEICKYVY